jgi:hypothetical protein
MMKIILARGHGKTIDAIRIAAEDGLYIVCIDRNEAGRVFSCSREFGLDIPFPITFSEFLEGRFSGKGIKGFVIDNADQLLAYIARGVPVAAITMTKEE